MNRRRFLQNAGPFAGVGFIAASLMNNSGAWAAGSAERIVAGPSAPKKRDMTGELSRSVQMQFMRLKKSGFRVIVGVSGHNVRGQIDMINQALEPVVADGTVAGIGLWEITLSRGPESGTDHAAKWETSDMMFFYPDCVDM